MSRRTARLPAHGRLRGKRASRKGPATRYSPLQWRTPRHELARRRHVVHAGPGGAHRGAPGHVSAFGAAAGFARASSGCGGPRRGAGRAAGRAGAAAGAAARQRAGHGARARRCGSRRHARRGAAVSDDLERRDGCGSAPRTPRLRLARAGEGSGMLLPHPVNMYIITYVLMSRCHRHAWGSVVIRAGCGYQSSRFGRHIG